MDANGLGEPFSRVPHGLDRQPFAHARGAQRDHETGPPARETFGANRPVELLAELARDVETDTDAALVMHTLISALALREGLEDVARVLGKTDALVLHR